MVIDEINDAAPTALQAVKLLALYLSGGAQKVILVDRTDSTQTNTFLVTRLQFTSVALDEHVLFIVSVGYLWQSES